MAFLMPSIGWHDSLLPAWKIPFAGFSGTGWAWYTWLFLPLWTSTVNQL